MTSKFTVNWPLVLLLGWSGIATGQNSTVFGGNSLAIACYHNSRAAVRTGRANRLDLAPCERAIDDVSLIKGDLAATYVNRGIVYAAMNDYVAAAKDYNTALSMNEDLGEAYLNRGNLWFLAKKYPQAIDDYQAALNHGINQPHVGHLNLGMVLEKLGDDSAAKESYQAALDIMANWPAAQQRLDRLLKNHE